MARYRPFIEAIQWTGSNVIEIRQFVNNSGGAINNAVIIDGVLTLKQDPGDVLQAVIPVMVNVTEWVVINGGRVTAMPNDAFIAQYELDT